jgi:hypothetical protein
MEILQIVEAHICTKITLFGMFNHDHASDWIVDADASTGLSFRFRNFNYVVENTYCWYLLTVDNHHQAATVCALLNGAS